MKSGLEIEIRKLEKEIGNLSTGSIVYRMEDGRRYPYHVWKEDGHESSVYLNGSSFESLLVDFRKRTELEEKLLEKFELLDERFDDPEMFHTSVLVGKELGELVGIAGRYPERRDLYEALRSCLYDGQCRDVLILYGQRNTGKGILMSQLIADMSVEDRELTAFIQIEEGNVIDDLSHDLAVLRDEGIRYVFIDEVTLLPDFISNASVLGSFFSFSMKIVISGSDDLGLMFAHRDSLFSRSILFHTDFWPFSEWSRIAGSANLDMYLERGGFHPGKDVPAASLWNIAENMEHSVVNYRGIGNLGKLENLRRNGELSFAIQAIMEDMTLDFLEGVGNEDFRERLDAFRRERDGYCISPAVRDELLGYLADMDIIRYAYSVDVTDSEMKPQRDILFIQPGLRYLLAMDMVERISVEETDVIESEVKARILSEAVLLSAISHVESCWYHAFRLKGNGCKVDMFIWDTYRDEVHIFTVDDSDNPEKELLDDVLREHIEDRLAKIVCRYVICPADFHGNDDGVEYINAEELLKKLDEVELPDHESNYIID